MVVTLDVSCSVRSLFDLQLLQSSSGGLVVDKTDCSVKQRQEWLNSLSLLQSCISLTYIHTHAHMKTDISFLFKLPMFVLIFRIYKVDWFHIKKKKKGIWVALEFSQIWKQCFKHEPLKFTQDQSVYCFVKAFSFSPPICDAVCGQKNNTLESEVAPWDVIKSHTVIWQHNQWNMSVNDTQWKRSQRLTERGATVLPEVMFRMNAKGLCKVDHYI